LAQKTSMSLTCPPHWVQYGMCLASYYVIGSPRVPASD
jgi:hypothetical protein